jgi:photosystem II stability/assembly factor-like uncharacterized protein
LIFGQGEAIQMKALTVLVGLFLFLSPMSFAQLSGNAGWSVIGPGGGGTTIGPTISPFDPNLVVEHCDMTGNYLTSDAGISWRMFNLRGGNSIFAFDPDQPKTIYAGNAALWRSEDAGRSWSMIFPDPARHTVEHQIGDHAEFTLTTDDPVYPAGEISALAVVSAAVNPKGPKRIYLAFQLRRSQAAKDGPLPAILVSSADGGSTWSHLADLPQRVLLLAPRPSGVVAISGSSAYEVTNEGHVVESGRIATDFRQASAAFLHDAAWIYATGRDGQVYLSEDFGVHWRPITPALGQSAGAFAAIATSAEHPQVAYAGFRGLQIGPGSKNRFNGIARTNDGGRSWKIVFKESDARAANLSGSWIEERAAQKGVSIWFDAPYSLGIAPGNPEIAYASDLFRTYRTLDGGSSWQQVNSRRLAGGWTSSGLDVTTNYGVQFDPFDTRHIYLDNTDIGLFQSTDGGRSWLSSSDGVPEEWRNTTYWIAFDPSQRGLIWGAFSGTHDLPRPRMWRHLGPETFAGGVGISTDGGRHWTPSNTGLPSSPITHILLDPSSPPGSRTLYACAFGHGVYKTTDNGKTWTAKNAGIEGQTPFVWRITPSQDGSLYLVVARRNEKLEDAPTGVGALYRSTDRAEHWQRIELPPHVTGPTGIAVDPRDPQHIYLTAWGREGTEADHFGGVFASQDAGRTWRTLWSESQHVYDLTIDSLHPDTLYITGFDAAAYRSVDRGQHWERIKEFDFKGAHRIFVDPVNPSQIYITTYGGGIWHGPATGSSGSETILNPVPVARPDGNQ